MCNDPSSGYDNWSDDNDGRNRSNDGYDHRGGGGRTVPKVNHDRGGGAAFPFGNPHHHRGPDANDGLVLHQALFGVYNGQGKREELMSEYILGEVPCLPPAVLARTVFY